MGLAQFLTIRTLVCPEYAGLMEFDKNAFEKKELYKVNKYGDERLSPMVGSTVLEGLTEKNPEELSILLVLLAENCDYGRYQGRGNPERKVLETLHQEKKKILSLPVKGLSSVIKIYRMAELGYEEFVEEMIDEVIERIAVDRVRDFPSLISILRTLAQSDFHHPGIFHICSYHLALHMDDIPPNQLPALLGAYRIAAHDAPELLDEVAKRHHLRTPKENTFIETILTSKVRHSGATPMITRGAQQDWLNIPGFKQGRR